MSISAIEPCGFWRRAIESPQRPALIGPGGETITYGTLYARVNRTTRLLASLGLVEGDHLTFALGQRPEIFEIVLACSQLGVWYTPASARLSTDELTYLLVDSSAKALVVDSTSAVAAAPAATAASLSPDCRLAFDHCDGWVDLRRSASEFAPSLPPDRRPGLALWYTSGTTGRPKGVMQRRPPIAMAELTQSAADHAAAYEWDANDVSLVQGPLYHAGPFVSALTMLHQGGLVVIMDKWTPISCLEHIDRYRVTASMMVPTMLHRLASLPSDTREQFDLSSLRRNGVMLGGSICPPETKRAMIDWWGPVIMESYGGSEGTFSRITSEDAIAHPGSVGRGWRGVTLQVLDDDGNACGPNEIGTVYARLASDAAHRPAYLNSPDKTDGSYVGEFFTLGDVGYLDAQGWLFLLDRRADLIVSGGANVYPAEVERVLLQHGAVDDVAVIGIPNDEWGQTVHALVVPRTSDGDDALAAALVDFARERLAAYKCPRTVTFVASVGRSEMGKLQRRKLRADPAAAIALPVANAAGAS